MSKERLGIKLKSSDIKEITRLGKRTDRGASRNVIVKFHDKATKSKLYEEKKKLATNKYWITQS